MRRRFPIALIAALLLPLLVRGSEPTHYTFSSNPPGTIVQSVLFYPTGQAMNSEWRAVVSKKLAGTSGHDAFYQWYLSMYAIDGEATYKLQYRSPGTDNFISAVKKYDSSLWLPNENVKIDGVGQFVQSTVEDLVVEKHEANADCGGGEVAVFDYSWTAQKIGKSIAVFDSCALHAKVIDDRLGYAIQLNGPYYGPKDPLCCPSKRNVTAILRYAHGTWTMKPNYFTISASLGAHGD